MCRFGSLGQRTPGVELVCPIYPIPSEYSSLHQQACSLGALSLESQAPVGDEWESFWKYAPDAAGPCAVMPIVDLDSINTGVDERETTATAAAKTAAFAHRLIIHKILASFPFIFCCFGRVKRKQPTFPKATLLLFEILAFLLKLRFYL
ncbi:hypothetical protein DdX_04468 [Ditylenchus destructor]|uniref:Uncharacterized protein n=1 Tax=Ditylenchus destructor TaxID=166010 RepID=A0AAD4ND43_9BILA|nr:hypothetical protein DdX_04468 [Ditylenchus destructor]